MDQRRATGPPPHSPEAVLPKIAGQAVIASTSDTDFTFVHQSPEAEARAACASTDMEDAEDGQTQGHTSDVDDKHSDYDPTEVEAEGDDEDDSTLTRKKQANKAMSDPLDIEELHEDWAQWEAICCDLLDKQKNKQLNHRQTTNLSLALKNLKDVAKQIPRSDPLRKDYLRFLTQNQSSFPSKARKRKNSDLHTAQNKKARLTQPHQGQSSATAVSQMAVRQSTKQHPASQISAELQKFKDQAEEANVEPKRIKSEVKNMEAALAAFGNESITAKDGCWLVQGMKTPLYSYQLDGAGWAIRRERTRTSPDNPRGGILADEMGCGKTITMLAVVMANPAPKSYKAKASLLLVQNVQMVKQWQKQIQKHCNKRSLSSCVYSRKSGLNTVSLSGNQLFIATYSELQRAWARLQRSSRKRTTVSKDESDEDDEDDTDNIEQDRLLFNTIWYRLVLDECQNIKNHNSATAKAIFQIKSKIQWLISATPTPNGVDEYFPYLKILGLSNTWNLGAFRRYWLNGKSKTDAGGLNNLEVGLAKFQLLRNHQTEIAGIPIFDDVPNSVHDERTVTMCSAERAIYDAVVAPVEREQKLLAAKIRDQQMLLAEKGVAAVEKSFIRKTKGAVARILELHKLTAHPFLLESIMRSKAFSASQIMGIRVQINHFEKSALSDQAEAVFAELEASGGYGRSPSIDAQSLVSASSSNGGYEKTSIDLQIGERALERKCHLCPGETIPIEAILSECGHAFCQRHFALLMKISKQETPEGPNSCSVCKEPIGTQRDVDQTDFVKARADFLAAAKSSLGDSGKSIHMGKKRIRQRGDDFNGYQPRGIFSFWLAESDRSHLEVPLSQSSKTRAVLETIDRWLDDGPDDKIIIFTQWIMMGKILGRSLQDKQINFLYYFGDMYDTERSKNLHSFENNKDIKVMIMGFRCGSQGLDMHYANRVILVDPWWNDDGESQSFARVKRKIQKKATFFLSLMAENTIDMRVAEIKKSKREMIQRLRKEDDPLKRSEIEMEYALKACELGLLADTVEPDSPEDVTYAVTEQRGTMDSNFRKDEDEKATVAEQQQYNPTEPSVISKNTDRIIKREDSADAMDVSMA
ncbi:hypothetical protein N0V93_010131 [Gnomoniopsis smithogilvyi]|uniref:Uncharacterized protein n=1 Tax=Gnomoniopsis smithogilvyi TaxID=1191159 RepID=A0A9W8YJB0_9PEZI|nr:hypothetical protein N0V93_010131 [Gnomoniopsis smithogilvyi]